ncbi:MAG: alpha-amylase family glycosyl hydrolase [Burkholderiaceae bacterium]
MISFLRHSLRAPLASVCCALLAACATPPNPGVDIAAVRQVPQAAPLPAGWEHGAFMEVFVRAYQDSDGNGIGDLRGLAQRLDYLQALGIKGLWLMPITASGDHDHGYAVTDYRAIEPAYGTLADFDELVRQAHAHGIGIILDYVINHSSNQNPLFVQSASAKANPWRDWYVWEDTKPAGWRIFDEDPWTMTPTGAYFAQFGKDMPDFNLRNPAVVAYHLDSLRFWLNHGVDGFRVDAVGHLFENGPQGWSLQPENYPFLGQLRRELDIDHPHVMVCESPPDPIGFAAPGACGSAFAFGHSDALVQAGLGDEKAIHDVADYFLTAPDSLGTMVSNHDHFAGKRLWNAMDGNPARVRVAAAAYLLQPGTPYVYYGEELGMSEVDTPSQDGRLRGPMSWTPGGGFTTGKPYSTPSTNLAANNAEAERANPDSTLAFYTAMLHLRNTHSSIATGRYAAPRVDGRTMSFQRVDAHEQTVVVINYGEVAGAATLAGLPANARLQRLYPGSGSAAPNEGLPVGADGILDMPAGPLSVQVFLVSR